MNPQQGSAYPPPPGQYAAPYRYDEPIDPQIPRGYPDHIDQGQLPIQPRQRPQGQSRTLSTSSEAKQRLRKACDSCSVRKVKVCATPSTRSWIIAILCVVSKNCLTGSSATRAARRVNHALRSRFLAPSNDQVVEGDLQTDMQKPSKDSDWRMEVTPPLLARLLMMPPTAWLRYHCHPLCRQSRYAI